MFHSYLIQKLSTEKKIILIFFIIVIIIFLFFKWFNRTPKRIIPIQQNAITSPANGKVIAIINDEKTVLSFFKKGIKNNVSIPDFMQKSYTAVVIEMNLGNIHAQRSSIDGELIYQKHIQGKFKNAVFSKTKTELAQENEKTISFFKSKDDFTIGIIQVAGLLARRIQSFGKIGDTYKKGEIFGRIILGSQVVIVLPKNVELQTEIGDIVIDGESIIAIKK